MVAAVGVTLLRTWAYMEFPTMCSAIRGKFQCVTSYVRNNRCKAKENTQELAKSSRVNTKTVYEGCSEGHPVWWFAFDGGHTPSPPGQFAAEET